LASGKADALAVAKLDRLSRSVIDFANTVALAEKQSWAVAGASGLVAHGP